jgi:hypothetical protein
MHATRLRGCSKSLRKRSRVVLLARTLFGIQNPCFCQFYRILPLPENSSGAAQDSTRIADPLKSSIRNLGSVRPAEKLRVTDSRTDTTISCVWTRRLPQGVCYARFIDVFWLIVLLAVSFGSLFIIINGLRKAPEAFEDEDGLHILPARPSGAGVLRNKKSPSKRRPRSRKTKPSLEFPVSHSP